MSDNDSPIISRDNLPTVAAVGFIVAVIALAFALWGFMDVRKTAAVTTAVYTSEFKSNQALAAAETKIAELEKRVAALEAAPAAPEPRAQGAGASAGRTSWRRLKPSTSTKIPPRAIENANWPRWRTSAKVRARSASTCHSQSAAVQKAS